MHIVQGHCAHRELGVVRVTELLHEQDVQIQPQLPGNGVGHGHTASRDGEHQRIRSAKGLQLRGERLTGIAAIAERHQPTVHGRPDPGRGFVGGSVGGWIGGSDGRVIGRSGGEGCVGGSVGDGPGRSGVGTSRGPGPVRGW